LLFCISVYVFYFKSVAIRERSKFASELAKAKEEKEGREHVEVVRDEILDFHAPDIRILYLDFAPEYARIRKMRERGTCA
jgi:hypothetical protein